MLGPIFFEFLAEISFPVPEATSGAVMVFIYNGTTLLMLLISPYINSDWFNSMQTGCFLLCLLLVCLVKEEYRRADAEKVLEKEEERQRSIVYEEEEGIRRHNKDATKIQGQTSIIPASMIDGEKRPLLAEGDYKVP